MPTITSLQLYSEKPLRVKESAGNHQRISKPSMELVAVTKT
jgi:hypothetical protein